MRRTRPVVFVLAAAWSASAWAQPDPNLNPWNPGASQQPPPGVAPEDWQIAREEVIGGRRFLVVRDAEGYIRQMGWDRERMVVYPKERTGLAKDLILSQDQSNIEATRGVVMRSGASSHVRLTYRWNEQTKHLDLVNVDRSAGGSRSAEKWRGPTNVRSYDPIDGQYVPGIVETPEPTEDGGVEQGVGAEVPVLSLAELARTELGIGDPEYAAELYRTYLEDNPGDVEAMRALGIAYLKCGRHEDAAGWVARAYATEPMLADQPLAPWIAGDSVLAMRRLRADAAKYAGEAGTPAAWLMVVVLMQGGGKPDAAIKLLDRAEAGGLDTAVATAMRRALNEPPAAP